MANLLKIFKVNTKRTQSPHKNHHPEWQYQAEGTSLEQDVDSDCSDVVALGSTDRGYLGFKTLIAIATDEGRLTCV